MSDINLSNLLPELKNAIEFVGATATAGIIGNRIDGWFVNLYYHEKKRITSWLSSWKLSEADKQQINDDEKLKIMFSQVTSNVANEIFEQKLLIWPTITESLLRNKKFEFDKKQYFINLFIKLDTFTINFLGVLYVQKKMDYYRVFPENKYNKPEIEDENFGYYLGQLQSAFVGTTTMYSDESDNKTYLKLSDLGEEFIEFISDSSIEKIKRIAGL